VRDLGPIVLAQAPLVPRGSGQAPQRQRRRIGACPW
jgi:hypothetical protein